MDVIAYLDHQIHKLELKLRECQEAAMNTQREIESNRRFIEANPHESPSQRSHSPS